MIKWALIGAGSWMENYHLPILEKLRKCNLIEIVGIWNRTIESAHRVAKQFMIPRVYDNIDELLEDSIDCVSIVLNKNIVAQYIQLVASSGIPFLTEKPPADSYREALGILPITKNISHIVGFNRRYLNIIQQTRQLLPPKITGYEFNMWRTNRNDNRYIFETGIHALNLVEYMFGPVIQVQILSYQDVADDITTINLQLTHERCIGVISFQSHANDAREQFRIFGKGRIIELFLNQPLAGNHEDSLMIFENGKWDSIKNLSTNFVDDYFGFHNEYLEMLDILSGSKLSSSTLESSLSCLRIAEWTESAKLGDILNI